MPAGGEVFHQGDAGDSLCIVAAGSLAAYVAGEDERGSVRVGTFAPGDLFGEMALFTGEPRTANIVAIEETEVLEIGHAAMKQVFDTNPDLVESLSYIIAERRQGLVASENISATDAEKSAGLLKSIRRFFGMK